jgi:hypothetical protein
VNQGDRKEVLKMARLDPIAETYLRRKTKYSRWNKG